MSEQTSQKSISANGNAGQGTAVVTGASSGIGKVYAEHLAQRGYDLLLVARRADRLEALAKEIRERAGVTVRTLAADLAHAGELEKVADAIANNPEITLLVNNAGTNSVGMLADTRWPALASMIQVNVLALARLTGAVLPGFKARNQGAMINVGSVLSFYSYPGSATYSGTKAFVLNFTRGLQAELAGTNVIVQLVAPAATESEIWEVSGMALSSLPPEVVMTTDDCVKASLRGLDLGEAMTLPSVHDPQLLADYEAAAANLLAASQTGKPAPRYVVAQ